MPRPLSFAPPSDRPPGSLAVDLDQLLAGHLFVQGASGSGKSHLLRQLLEQTHGRVRHVVVDPEGEYHTLPDGRRTRLTSSNTSRSRSKYAAGWSSSPTWPSTP